MTYKIIEKIGKYKIGDEVTDEVGMVLAKMFVNSPVERVEKKPDLTDEEKAEKVKLAEEAKAKKAEDAKDAKKKKGFFN